MDIININQYLGKKTGDTLSASSWNGVFAVIQSKINEIVEKLNSGDSNTGGGEDNTQKFTINGEEVTATNGVITLTAGSKYILSGETTNKIVVDASGATAPGSNTELVLKGVTITTADNCAILYKTPEVNTGYKDLIITLAKDTTNIVIAGPTTVNVGLESNDPGAIYSMNNMTVQGAGYLAVVNGAGHGIRATELKIVGPHIYANTNHDCIHAGKKLYVCGGYFYFEKGNDGFGTGERGSIYYFGGEVVGTSGSVSTLFDSKDTGYVWNHYTKSAKLHTITDALTDLADAYAEGSVTVYPTKNDYSKNTNGVTILPGAVYDGAWVKGEDVNSASLVIAETEAALYKEAYAIPGDHRFVKISGKITAPIIIPAYCGQPIHDVDPTKDNEWSNKGKLKTLESDTDIYLDGAYIDTANAATILYLPEDGRVKITCVKDTINVVMNHSSRSDKDMDAVKSENNISLEIKNDSYLLVQSVRQDGIDGGNVKITDSKGVLMINRCGQRGIKGNAIVIGPNANIDKSVVTATTETDSSGYYTDPKSTDYSVMEGAVLVEDNCTFNAVSAGVATAEDADVKQTGFADIYARNGKHNGKGVFGTTDAELKGVLITGSIGGVVSLNLGNAENLYYRQIITPSIVSNDPGASVEEYAFVTDSKQISYENNCLVDGSAVTTHCAKSANTTIRAWDLYSAAQDEDPTGGVTPMEPTIPINS